MMNLYWQIGKDLSEKQAQGWGKSVVETLSKDIQKEFPGIKGFGARNLGGHNEKVKATER